MAVDSAGAMAKARRTTDNNAPVENNTGANGEERVTTDDSRERIAARAYEMYLARGGGDGQDWDDWLAAERELSDTEPRSDRTE